MLSGRLGELADYLFQIGCIEVGEFWLKEHESKNLPPSPVKFNFRTFTHPGGPGPLTPVGMAMIGKAMASILNERGLKLDRLVGLPSAGEPIAASLATALDLPEEQLIRLNKVRLREGHRKIVGPVEGRLAHGDFCVMVDDVISLSRSKMEGRSVLARKGALLENLLVVVDREQGGHRLMRQVGVQVHCLFRARVLLAHGIQQGHIEAGVADSYNQYLKLAN